MTEFESIPAGVVIETSKPIWGKSRFIIDTAYNDNRKGKRWFLTEKGCYVLVNEEMYHYYGCKIVGRIKNRELLSTLPHKKGTVILMVGDLKNKHVAAKYDPSWGKGMGAWIDKYGQVVHQSGMWNPLYTYIAGNPHIDFTPFITQV